MFDRPPVAPQTRTSSLEHGRSPERLGRMRNRHVLPSIMIAAAMEMGCSSALRMRVVDRAPTQELTAAEVPEVMRPQVLEQARERLMVRLQALGVQRLERVAPHPVRYEYTVRTTSRNTPSAQGLLTRGGEFDPATQTIFLSAPLPLPDHPSQAQEADYGHEAYRATSLYRHELLHAIAFDVRLTPEQQHAHRDTHQPFEVTDPYEHGTDLHEAMTAFLTNITSEASDSADDSYPSGQILIALVGEGLRRSGDQHPEATLAQTYFNQPHLWGSLVERAAQTLVDQRVIPSADVMRVAVNRLMDSEQLQEGSTDALTHRLDRFLRDAHLDERRLWQEMDGTLATQPRLRGLVRVALRMRQHGR